MFPKLLLMLLFALPVYAEEPPPNLTVRGEARLELPADQAHLNLAVVTTAPTTEGALRQNSDRLRAVEESLVKAGVKPGDYRTGRFTIRPEWSPRPRNAGSDWQPAIVGYTVTNSLDLTTGDLPRIGAFIEAGIGAGANSVENLSFDLADQASHRARAIAEATKTARGEAEALAAAAGVRLGKVLSLQLDPGEPAPQVRMMRLAAEAAAPPIIPGEVTVRAAVTAVYGIEPD